MDRNQPNEALSKTGDYFNVALLVFSIVPILALSLYNHPSAADDYCFIYTVNVHGWIGGMSKYYNEWTGRYFTIFLNHSNPLLFDSFAGFKAASVLTAVSLAGSLYYLVRTVVPTFTRLTYVGMAGVVMFLFLLRIPSTAEAFYWFASVVTYTVPAIMILVWIALTMRWYQCKVKSRKTWIGTVCCLLVFAAIGSSETTLLLMVVLIGAWLIYQAVIVKKPDILMLSVTATAVVSCYFLFAAPGNTARLGGNPVSGNIPLAAWVAIRFILAAAKNWIFGTPILLFSIGWFWALTKLSLSARQAFTFPLWLTAISYFGLLFAIVFPSFYAVSTELDPTPRVVNSLYFFFLIGWFYFTGALFLRVVGGLSAAETPAKPLWIALTYVACLAAVGGSIVRTPNYKTLYRDWLKGDARAYDLEMQARYATLRDTQDPNPVIPPIQTRPASLFVEDITNDPKGWWNWCMAGYFGKETITLTKETGDSSKASPNQ